MDVWAATSDWPEAGDSGHGLRGRHPRGLVIYAVAALLATAGDGAVFWWAGKSILGQMPHPWLIILAVGFASMAVMLAHHAGSILRLRKIVRWTHPGMMVVAALMWAAIGAVTFWSDQHVAASTCVLVGPPPITCVAISSSGALLGGYVFAGVYFAAGVITVTGAYLTQEDALIGRLNRVFAPADRGSSGEFRNHYRFPAQRLTGFAARVAGGRRTGVLEEWCAHLANQESKWHGYKIAIGFLAAALQFRLADAADVAWTPVDAILKSRTLSNLLVLGISGVATIDVARYQGRLGVVVSAESLIGIGSLVYGLIRVGRWYRDAKPPEPKARRAKNNESD
jgi:hypothetical protein